MQPVDLTMLFAEPDLRRLHRLHLPMQDYRQHEISRLTADNLDLQENNDLLSEQLKKYRSQMKLAKKVKQEGVLAENQEASPEVHETVHSSRRNERSESPLPVVRKKETITLGCLILTWTTKSRSPGISSMVSSDGVVTNKVT
jgi:hypothetical protein